MDTGAAWFFKWGCMQRPQVQQSLDVDTACVELGMDEVEAYHSPSDPKIMVSTACSSCTVAMPLLRLRGELPDRAADLPTSAVTCTSPWLFLLPTTTRQPPVLAK